MFVRRFHLMPQVTWITDAQFRRLAAALALSTAVAAKDYGLPAPSFDVESDPKSIPEDSIPIVFASTIDVPADLAYHELLDGRPHCVVLSDHEQVSLSDIEQGADHEAKETMVDPTCDQSMHLPTGGQIAFEISDPVQADTIPLDLGEGEPVSMSNHVTPAWFDVASPPGTRLDAAGLALVPLLVRPNGYALVISPDGRVSQVGAGAVKGYRRHPRCRYGRRLAWANGVALRLQLGYDRTL